MSVKRKMLAVAFGVLLSLVNMEKPIRKKKNPAAVALALRRKKKLTAERRREIAKKAAGARWRNR